MRCPSSSSSWMKFSSPWARAWEGYEPVDFAGGSWWDPYQQEWIMAPKKNLDAIKPLAKKLSRAQRIKHISGLELIAHELGYPHWNALTADYKKGWRPPSTQIATVQGLVDAV